jgi:hypothetical protein
VEVKGNEASPHDDPFTRVEKEKKTRVKKQKQNEMRNMAAYAKAEEKKKGTLHTSAVNHTSLSLPTTKLTHAVIVIIVSRP